MKRVKTRVHISVQPAVPALPARPVLRWPASPALPALVVAAMLSLCGAAGCNRPPDDPKDYVARIATERSGKDADFQRSNDPIPTAKKAEFLPLAYFPIDPEYNVLAGLTPATERVEQMVPTSTGTLRKMLQVGTLDFTLKGQPMSLVAFTEGDLNTLSVMFSDMTSGTETYPAGRYIDLTRTVTGVYEIGRASCRERVCLAV